jgi:hypothetical protein
MELPNLRSGEPCPTAGGGPIILDRIGPILGDGPIYPAFLGENGVFSLQIGTAGNEPYQIRGREWWAKKTLWLSDDTYDGIALVRGARIDDEHDVLFFEGTDPDPVNALRLTTDGWVYGGSPAGWREFNTGTLLPSPGCYAFQIDGEAFTDVVVVEATAQ